MSRVSVRGTEAGVIEVIREELVDNLCIPVRGISIHRDGHCKVRVHILLPWAWFPLAYIFKSKQYVKQMAEQVIGSEIPAGVKGRVTVGWFKPWRKS